MPEILEMAKPKSRLTGGKVVERNTSSIQIEKDLARKAAVIASHRRISQAALISPVIREFIEAQYAIVSSEIQREVKDKKAHG